MFRFIAHACCKRLRHICFGLFTLLSLRLQAEPVSYFYSELPPYEYSNAAGGAAGIGIEKIRKILTDAGFQPEFRFYSVSRGLNALQHDIDFSAVVAPTTEQRQQLKISAAPVYLAEIGVVRLRNTKPLNTLAQLTQYPYVALSDTRFAYLQQRPALAGINANRYDIGNQQDAYRLLISGRYKYYLCYHASNLPLSNPMLVFDSLEQIPVYLVLSKQNPDVDRLMQRVDEVMAKP